jgi:hypothetical protein
MAGVLPAFIDYPQPTIVDPIAVTVQECNDFLHDIGLWHTQVTPQLAVFVPHFVPPPQMAAMDTAPAVPHVQDDLNDQMEDLRLNVTAVFMPYAAGYAAFAAALAQGNLPQVPPLAAAPQRPKMKLPENFTGKGLAAARHFPKECNNYIRNQQITSEEERITWALQLMVEGAATWRDETLSGFDDPQLPAHLATWADFQTHFKGRWNDPYEANKSLVKIMSGTIQQTTSVKKYNDVFNEALDLTTENGTNGMVLAAYENGLKPAVLNSAGPDRRANPAMTFAELQQLIVQIDETLQWNNTRNQTTRTAPQQRTTSHNLVANPQTPAANTAGSIPQTTPASTYV